jgi:hypothetical protein
MRPPEIAKAAQPGEAAASASKENQRSFPNIPIHPRSQANPVSALADDLEVIADWLDELEAKVRRAHLRFEHLAFDRYDHEDLVAEVELFTTVCQRLAAKMPGRLA